MACKLMKTLLLFHRLELTDMFGPLSRELAGKVNIVHVAYSMAEQEKLRKYDISGEVVVFKEEIRRLLSSDFTCNSSDIEALDADIIKYTDKKFNLNGSIQSDRGFSLLSYKECLSLTVAYSRFWEDILCEYNVDYVMHEPISLMMNFICAINCKKSKVNYLYQMMCPPEVKGDCSYLTIYDTDFSCPDIEKNYRQYQSGAKIIDRDRMYKFFGEFS